MLKASWCLWFFFGLTTRSARTIRVSQIKYFTERNKWVADSTPRYGEHSPKNNLSHDCHQDSSSLSFKHDLVFMLVGKQVRKQCVFFRIVIYRNSWEIWIDNSCTGRPDVIEIYLKTALTTLATNLLNPCVLGRLFHRLMKKNQITIREYIFPGKFQRKKKILSINPET